ncbi:ferredoxin [bacterium]|jgi:ferredoxin|nr:ferredoxin [bacterium]
MEIQKHQENVSGQYFVDSECIACDTCCGIAALHFKLTEDWDHAYVCKQPDSAKEKQTCDEALDACPVDAIHKN